MSLRLLLLLILCSPLACGGSRSEHQAAATPSAQPVPTPASDPSFRAPAMPWWQGAEPQCGIGKLTRRNLSWGAVYWCAVPGQKPDASLQNDLGRLARCVNEAVSAFQVEPTPGSLGDFLARAHEEGLNPVLCAAVRRDSEPRTYHGREILFERREEPDSNEASTEVQVRYRFSCADCLVAAETSVRVAR